MKHQEIVNDILPSKQTSGIIKKFVCLRGSIFMSKEYETGGLKKQKLISEILCPVFDMR